MAKQTFLSVLLVVVIAVLLGWLLSVNIDTSRLDRGFPWQIEIMPDGSTQVMQINLGHTTLGEAAKKFNVSPEFTMFAKDGELAVIEAYFNTLRISSLNAKMVVSFDLSEAGLSAIYNRGIRISTMGSGTRKVTIHPDDIAYLQTVAINSITYIPATNLDADIIKKRFGEPAERIQENAATEHWLYPKKGLDLLLNRDAKEVLQYVLPSHFSAISEPLKQHQKEVNPVHE